MPSRVIRGEINESHSLSLVSLEAELTFRALLLAVDDFGRLDARPAKLKAALFPMRDEITAEIIMGWLEELAKLEDPPLVFYELDTRRYLYLPKWEKHRGKGRRAQESRYPSPPQGEILGDPRKSEETPGNPRPGRGTSSEGRMSWDDATAPSAPPAASDPRRRKTNCPDWLDPPGYARVEAWATEVVPRTVAPTLDSWIEDALGYYRREGKQFVDWPQAVMDNIRSRVNADRKREGHSPLPTMAQAKKTRLLVEKRRAEMAQGDLKAVGRSP